VSNPRVANWSVWDGAIESYVRDNYDSVRILGHVDDPEPGAKSERFTEPNRGWSVLAEIERAQDLGLGYHFCLDIYLGNGRTEAGGSATGPGKYHHTWTEGGVARALDRVFAWLPKKGLLSFCLINEMADKQWLADFYLKHWAAKVKAKCKQNGIPMVGYDGEFLGPMFKKVADVIDVHGIASENSKAAGKIKAARRLGLPVWILEFSGKSTGVHRGELQRALGELRDGEAIGAFPGSTEFPRRGSVDWNGKNHPTFNHCWQGGTTDPGEDWQDLLGDGDSSPPIDPPDPPIPPDPPPGPDPGDDVDLGRARIQNKKARGALERGRVSVAQSILERQAKSLGI